MAAVRVGISLVGGCSGAWPDFVTVSFGLGAPTPLSSPSRRRVGSSCCASAWKRENLMEDEPLLRVSRVSGSSVSPVRCCVLV